MTDQRAIKLSKFLALVLRHRPERFGLEIDRAGWTSLSQLMATLKSLPNFRWVDRSDLAELVQEGAGDGKKRFEIDKGRIRARYGHSFTRRVAYQPVKPPPRLYHGTSPSALPAIERQGLRPMGRQYVHLSPDRGTALHVGARHTRRPVVLTIRAREAHQAGIAFYHPAPGVFLTEQVPPSFLTWEEGVPTGSS